MKRVLAWTSVAAVSAVVGWLFCFLSAMYVFRKYQPVDLMLEDDDE